MDAKESRKKVTAVICTYNRYDVLPSAIESLTRQSLDVTQYNILVVDNSPDAQIATRNQRKYSTISNLIYHIEARPGLSNARNVAARIAETDYVSFIDDDAIASPEWLSEILYAFENFGPKTAIVGGRVDPIWGSERPKWLHDSLLGHLSVVNWGGTARVANPDEWFAGTNISFKTQDILNNGGFAVSLGRIGSGASLLSNEEIELVARIRAKGGQLVYAPKGIVNHLAEPVRLQRGWFRKRAAWQAVSDYMMSPDKSSKDCSEKWSAVLDYFMALPPHERSVRGFAFETDDPELFRWQLSAIYNNLFCELSGFSGVSLESLNA